MSGQHKGISGEKPLSTNAIAGAINRAKQEAGTPNDDQSRISYGIIAEVDDDTNRIRISLLDQQGNITRLGAGPDGKGDGIWIPILQPIEMIHHLYGSLRKGLCVRVFWKGKKSPGGDSIAEIVSDLESVQFLSGSKNPRSNELATGAHQIFMGGSGVKL